MEDSLEEYIKLTRNVKEDPSPAAKISKEMQITAQFKKECDSRAMKIVEFAIEEKLRPEIFIKCLPFIHQEHYQDIVEERAITKLCGYPLCGKKIPDMPKKQYYISTKSNKVYDITERKNFCSNFCYKASLHIKEQIGTSPLWLRRLEDIPEYNLLHISEGGLPGEYIDQGVVKPVSVDTTFTPISSFTEVGLSDLIDREIKPGKLSRDRPKSFKKSKLQNTMQTIDENEVIEDKKKGNKAVQSKVNKKEVKDSIKNEVATCKMDVHKKGVIKNLPVIEEKEDQKENNDKNKAIPKPTETTELKENINIINKISEIKLEEPDKNVEERLKSIGFVNEITKIIPKREDESSTKKDLIHDIKTTENNQSVKNKVIRENKDPIEEKIIIMSSTKTKPTVKTNEPKSPDTVKNIIDKINAKPGKESKLVILKENITENPEKIERETPKQQVDIETVVQNAVSSWLTLDSCIFIHGEAKVKHILNENKLSDYFDELNVMELQREQQMKYMEICRRLQFQEMADDKFDKGVTGNHKLQPLPDYKQLKQEAKDLKLKVKSFYEGDMYEQEDKNFPAKINKKEELGGAPAVLPPVDLGNQHLLRRKIFLNSLNKGMQQLLQSLGISYYTTVLSDLQGLVKTFTLRADNITFKPTLWTYIALVLLHMLALRDANIKREIEDEIAREYIDVLCEVTPNKRDFISEVLSDIQDVELFVQNYIKKANV